MHDAGVRGTDRRTATAARSIGATTMESLKRTTSKASTCQRTPSLTPLTSEANPLYIASRHGTQSAGRATSEGCMKRSGETLRADSWRRKSSGGG